MKRIAILGSTGSIGQNTLEVIRQFPHKLKVAGLSANSNVEILIKQIREFRPQFVCLGERGAAEKLKKRIGYKVELFSGKEGLESLAQAGSIDKIVLAISGAAALSPLLKAIEADKEIALANKEALVMAGPVIRHRLRAKKAKIIPVDSEQSAIWQCLNGQPPNKIKNIYLTASGGPLRKTRKQDFRHISPRRVLRHPRWRMGEKITVDSATLMNKGLEILETMFLFNVDVDKIKVLIHPQAIIHSMVEFIDGVILAQLSITDMRIPIQYALSYPERLPNRIAGIDFYKLRQFHFEKPDFKRFPCLGLAYRAARELGTAPCALNAANEVSVGEFLKRRLKFVSIPEVIEKVLDKHRNIRRPDLADIQEADIWARKEAYRVIDNKRNP